MAIPTIPKPPTSAMVDERGFVTAEWRNFFLILHRKLGNGGVEAAELSVTGNAATATAADTVPPLTSVGTPDVTQPTAAEGTLYQDTSTGNVYYRTGGSWRQVNLT